MGSTTTGAAPASSAARSRRRLTLATAAVLFAAVFAIRVSDETPGHLVTLLFAVPIAIVAVELGVRWGLAAAALALGMYGVWDVAWAHQAGTVLDYLTRGLTFLVLGGVLGALADRLREVSADSTRFWELSNELLAIAGIDGYFKRLNPAWERTLGWTLEELCSRPFAEFVHPDDRAQTEAEAAGLTGERPETLHFENRYRCKDGSYRTLVWSAIGVPEEELIYAVARDGTDTKRAEQELRRSEQFLDSVLENLPSMVFVKDAKELRFVRFNRAGEELLGRSREDLVGKNDHDLFPAEQAGPSMERDRQVLATGEVVDIPEEQIDTAGGKRILHTRKVAIRDERGEPQYLLGVSQDITDRKSAEQAVEAARAEAERANAAKSEFLSRMSHELRTPMNSVLGFAELLWMDGVVDEQRDYVGQIRKSGRHLLDLINEVLDLSRIEAGQMTISPEPVQLRGAVVEALEMIAPEAASRGVELEPEYGAICDAYVRADQQRLKQVLLNLLSNAVKYNRPGGSVRVRCAHRDGHDAPSVAVTDTGPGIPADQLDRLFNPFDRLGAEGGGEEGTGLGLALSKRLVELMDGRLWAESDVGVGTTFWLELSPADAPRLDPAAAPAVPDLAAAPHDPELTVLYIEDNVSNFELIKGALARLGSPTLLSAMQGRLGIDLATQHQPDVVLLDLHLPDMHGSEVLAQLKSDPRTRSIPIIVLSADATQRQVRRLLDAGAYEYLTKPVDIPRFLATIQHAAREWEARV